MITKRNNNNDDNDSYNDDDDNDDATSNNDNGENNKKQLNKNIENGTFFITATTKVTMITISLLIMMISIKGK